ncbi:MAG: 2-oxo acid dehydrogenase subunit E2 [Anaerolineales bacterium]|nr:2-oxo acid dehydrogenase subunit E2 [Anaerolineales bacterium]
MAKTVIMPKFGFTQENAQIVRWLKRAGEAVEQGDPIAEVTTDKVNMEVEAPATGILDGLQFAEGDTVPVTAVIAFVRGQDEVLESVNPSPATRHASTKPAIPRNASPATPVAQKLAQELGVDVNQVAGTGPGGRVMKRDVEAASTPHAADGIRAVPAARRLARELNVDLSAVAGSGPHGRIQSADVREAAVPAPRHPSPEVTESHKLIPFTGMRRTIATRLQKSFQEAPHIFFDAYIDVSEAEALRAALNERLGKEQARISLTAIIAKACGWALTRHPLVNSRIEGENIVLLNEVNVGIAVALEAGLIVPVVSNVPHKGLAQIAGEIADVAERARSNRLRPQDVADGTFSISNLGMFGVDKFTAIINPPQVAILAVSRARKQFVPDENDQPMVRPIMTVTLSADHRVVDGAVTARFLQDVRAALEQPALMML